MFSGPRNLSTAIEDFRSARRQAALEEIMARFTGRSATLLSYEEVRQKLRATSGTPRGVQEILVEAIVGSVGRYADFTRSFLPRQNSDEGRWINVLTAAPDPGALPPIEVYQIGQAYFVSDGHHRVSVARQKGIEFISAHVTQVHTPVPLEPDAQPDDLIVKAEEAAFLEYTGLGRVCSGADLAVTVPGQYAHLENHIEVQRYWLEEEQNREISLEEAARHWYTEAYLPVVQVIRRQGILQDFPGRTETDLFVWIAQHRLELQRALGWPLRPEATVASLAERSSSKPKRIAARVGRKILEAVRPNQFASGPPTGQWRKEHLPIHSSGHLFDDVLVALSGEEAGWRALDQALVIAQHEEARVYGFHAAPAEAQVKSERAQSVEAEFYRRCQAVELEGKFVFEVGQVASGIAGRSRWVDLVVLSLSYPPESRLAARLASGIRTILLNCARPVLAVPGPASRLERALLAYDGSLRAQEALFVATYLAGQWQMPLVVVTVENERTELGAGARVREYLEQHGIQATFVQMQGEVAGAILETAQAHKCDWIIMGSYGPHPLVEALFGSTVDHVLYSSRLPILICR